jgi:hypothetical protein
LDFLFGHFFRCCVMWTFGLPQGLFRHLQPLTLTPGKKLHPTLISDYILPCRLTNSSPCSTHGPLRISSEQPGATSTSLFRAHTSFVSHLPFLMGLLPCWPLLSFLGHLRSRRRPTLFLFCICVAVIAFVFFFFTLNCL